MFAKKDKRRRRSAVKWTDKVNLVFSGALLLFAGASAVVSFWQWGEAREQLAFAKKSAIESGRETREALRISRELALSSRNQVAALIRSAESAERYANSSEQQARLAARERLIAEIPKIDIKIESKRNGSQGFVSGSYILTNTGIYPIDAEVEHVSAIANFFGIRTFWTGNVQRDKLRLIPGVPRLIDDRTQVERGREVLWQYYRTESASIYHSIRVTYRDIGGAYHVQKQCITENITHEGIFKACPEGWDETLSMKELKSYKPMLPTLSF